MSHFIRGFVLPARLSTELAKLLTTPAICSLQVGALVFVPIGDNLQVADSQTVDHFDCLSALEESMRALSRSGPIAYIETEYFGGEGVQSSTAWRDGALVLERATAPNGPINAALRILGVTAKGSADEFDVAGLGQHRFNDDWMKAVR